MGIQITEELCNPAQQNFFRLVFRDLSACKLQLAQLSLHSAGTDSESLKNKLDTSGLQVKPGCHMQVISSCGLVTGTTLAPVVPTLNSTIHQINHYPAYKYLGNLLLYPVDRDLSTK